MVILLDYELVVPKASFDIYFEHILKGIYNFKNWPDHAKIISETETSWNIKFTMCNFVPIALVLPDTICEEPMEFFTDASIYNRIKNHITEQINIARSEVMEKLTPLVVGNISLESVVHQLAVDKIINKFAPCDHGVYLISTL